MQVCARDVRQSQRFREVNQALENMFAVNGHEPVMARSLSAHEGTGIAFFTGLTFRHGLECGPDLDIWRYDSRTENISLFCKGGTMARVSPDGRYCAVLLEGLVSVQALAKGAQSRCFTAPGVIEDIRWSPDGNRLGLLVAGSRADVAGYQGGFAMQVVEDGPDWLPDLETANDDDFWRSVWICDLANGITSQATKPPLNIWEFAWHGNEGLIAVASRHHSEGSWYSAALWSLPLGSEDGKIIYQPSRQIGQPVVSPDGTNVAFIEAVCSDRGIICGSLRLLEGNDLKSVSVVGLNVTHLAWRDDRHLVCSGLNGFESAVIEIDCADGKQADLWRSTTMTCGDWYPEAAPWINDSALLFAEGYSNAPFLAEARCGEIQLLYRLAGSEPLSAEFGICEAIDWIAPDGMRIEGLLVSPREKRPGLPLVVDIHGGPIWAYRPRWAGRLRTTPFLAASGCAVLLPNPRGSGGRGDDFAQFVIGDMAGADTQDILAGVDALIEQGLADKLRVGVTGSSYGGFMSCWLVATTDRFAAAAPMSPVSNWYSQHFTSQIPAFDDACVEGSPFQSGGQYFDRSPVFRATNVTAPCLVFAGARDKNTPASQAREFHQATIEGGGQSVLCVYPKGGHSLRSYPEYIDSTVRTLMWFDLHLGLRSAQ